MTEHIFKITTTRVPETWMCVNERYSDNITTSRVFRYYNTGTDFYTFHVTVPYIANNRRIP